MFVGGACRVRDVCHQRMVGYATTGCRHRFRHAVELPSHHRRTPVAEASRAESATGEGWMPNMKGKEKREKKEKRKEGKKLGLFFSFFYLFFF